jgi:hypothetical protein
MAGMATKAAATQPMATATWPTVTGVAAGDAPSFTRHMGLAPVASGSAVRWNVMRLRGSGVTGRAQWPGQLYIASRESTPRAGRSRARVLPDLDLGEENAARFAL